MHYYGSIHYLLKSLTIDIIASTTLDVQLNTQRSPSLPARLFAELIEMQALLDGTITLANLNPYVHWRRYKACKDLADWLQAQIRSHLLIAKEKMQRDIVDLAIQEFGQTLSVEDYAETAKSFLFAGHDTTAGMLSWMYYILTQHPEIMRKLKEEHEQVFGSDGRDTEGIYLQIMEKPGKLSELKYTLQCMKETLRLYPPAATARMGQDEKLPSSIYHLT